MTDYVVDARPQGPVLDRFYRARNRIDMIRGPLGSGKTTTAVLRVFKTICEQEPNEQDVRKSRWVVVRNTYPDLFGTAVKEWRSVAGDELGRFVQGGREPPTHHLGFGLPDGTRVEAEVIFVAMDRPDHVKKIRGANITAFWLNEVKELDKAVVDMCDLRHGRFPSGADGFPTWHGMLGDYNSPDSDHWLYHLAEVERPADWCFHHQPGGVTRGGMIGNRVVWKLNPAAENLQNLPDGYYAKGMQGKSDDWIAVNLANEYGFLSDGRPVYPEYADAQHCRILQPIPNVPIWRGWDYGLTPACEFAQVGPNGQLRFLHELTSKRSGIDRFSDEVLRDSMRLFPGFRFEDFGDESGGYGAVQDEIQSCFEIQWAKGIEVQPAVQSPRIRVESVRYGLNTLIDGEPALVIDPACGVLRKGFMGGYEYRRIQVSGERFHEKPDKNQYSHPHDCAQYLAAEAFGEIIQSSDRAMKSLGVVKSERRAARSGGVVVQLDDERPAYYAEDNPWG